MAERQTTKPRTRADSVEAGELLSAVQLALDLLPLQNGVAAHVWETALHHTGDPRSDASQGFVRMLRESHLKLLAKINASEKPFTSLRVWSAVVALVDYGTCELTCSRKKLAETAGVPVAEASRALPRLVAIDALTCEVVGGRRRYRLHPSVAWYGPESDRLDELAIVQAREVRAKADRKARLSIVD